MGVGGGRRYFTWLCYASVVSYNVYYTCHTWWYWMFTTTCCLYSIQENNAFKLVTKTIYFWTAHFCKILLNPGLMCGAPCPKGQLTWKRTSIQNVKRERNKKTLNQLWTNCAFYCSWEILFPLETMDSCWTTFGNTSPYGLLCFETMIVWKKRVSFLSERQ